MIANAQTASAEPCASPLCWGGETATTLGAGFRVRALSVQYRAKRPLRGPLPFHSASRLAEETSLALPHAHSSAVGVLPFVGRESYALYITGW